MLQSFKSKFIFFNLLVVITTCCSAFYLVYSSSVKTMENFLGQRLKAIAINATDEIDVSSHQKIYQEFLKGSTGIEKTIQFQKVQKQLKIIKERNELKSEVYTYALPEWANGKAVFIAMSAEKTFIGNAMEATKYMRQVWSSGETIYTLPYYDSEGSWISALAPIKNKQGKVVAIFEVDFNINKEVAAIKSDYLGKLIPPLILGAVLAFFVGFILGNRLTKKISLISHFTSKIRNNNYGTVLPTQKVQDELSELVENFNSLSINLKEKEDNLATVQVEMNRKSNLASLGEMSAGIAHEINNPITIIYGKSQEVLLMIKKNKMNEEKAMLSLEKIGKMVFRIEKIVNSLRKYSRDGSGDELELCSIYDIVDESLDLCSYKLASGGVKLDIDESCKQFSIHASPVQLSQVIVNMVSNSVHAVQGLNNKWIKIHCEEDGEMINMYITDSGKGIPMEVQEKLFTPFFTTKAVGVGTGIGMSITQGIMNYHKGKIYINNESPNTQFVLSFPKIDSNNDKEKLAS